MLEKEKREKRESAGNNAPLRRRKIKKSKLVASSINKNNQLYSVSRRYGSYERWREHDCPVTKRNWSNVSESK